MKGEKIAALGYALRRQVADIGYGARLFVRLLRTLSLSLRRFGLIRDQIHFACHHCRLWTFCGVCFWSARVLHLAALWLLRGFGLVGDFEFGA